ncbi:MAG: NAD(P)-dependent oxidoreductase [Acidobacteria bacterium]|nr:NAD(P)-dependent oxidoreductase [Acidobacteriota bacterium]
MPRRILVTGVSGFVGGALGAHLRRLGHHVIGVSRTDPREGAVDEHIRCDLREPIGTLPAADAVVHCAALASPWAARRDYQASNVDATAHVLDWTARNGIARFVFISSSSVHYTAGADQENIREDSPLPARAINDYAATKRAAEELVRQSKLNAVILRPRAVFGPGDTVLFPRILRAAELGKLPRIVRADGVSPRADLIYIDNLSHYIERALESDIGGEFNLTNNEPVELYPFLDAMLDKLGLPRPRKNVGVATAMLFARGAELVSDYLLGFREPPVTRFGVEVMAYSKTFDVSKMLAAFGPPPVSLAEGVEQFIAWQQRQS